MNITIEQLKRQLRIEPDYTDDDVLLQYLLDTAEISVENFLGANALSGYTSNDIPTPVLQATIMLAGHWYLNPNMVAFGLGTEVPYSFQFLLNPYKQIVIV
jgi:hypothetical protein